MKTLEEIIFDLKDIKNYFGNKTHCGSYGLNCNRCPMFVIKRSKCLIDVLNADIETLEGEQSQVSKEKKINGNIKRLKDCTIADLAKMCRLLDCLSCPIHYLAVDKEHKLCAAVLHFCNNEKFLLQEVFTLGDYEDETR